MSRSSYYRTPINLIADKLLSSSACFLFRLTAECYKLLPIKSPTIFGTITNKNDYSSGIKLHSPLFTLSIPIHFPGQVHDRGKNDEQSDASE